MKKILLLLLLCPLAGCELVIKMDVPEQEPKLVLNSLINDGDSIEAYITWSKTLSTTTQSYPPAENAEVALYEDGVFIENLIYYTDFPQSWKANHLPVPGREYKLEAKVAETAASGTTILPQPVQIDKVEVMDSVRQDADGFWETDITFYFTDRGGETNYYGLQVMVAAMGNAYPVCYFTNNPVLEPLAVDFGFGSERPVICGTVLFTDEVFEGQQYNITITIRAEELSFSDEVQLRLMTSSREYYYYTRSSKQQLQNQGNPFGEPVVVFNNIENGLGIVAGYSEDVEVFVP